MRKKEEGDEGRTALNVFLFFAPPPSVGAGACRGGGRAAAEALEALAWLATDLERDEAVF